MIHIIKRFLSYVEIRTKIASVLPFLLGLFYSVYAYGQISLRNTALFFVSMLLFDMATTALNNYIDTKTNKSTLQFHKAAARLIIYFLLLSAIVAGLALVFNTSLVVLFCGALCFFIGIFYTFGPAPISRMPLGELFSGVFMGFFIPFLVVLINAPVQSLVYFSFSGMVLQLNFNIEDLIKLAVITVPAICGVANIMLANNICDIETDIQVNRFTLPFYIGKKNALRLFAFLYYAAFAATVTAAALRILPLYTLLALLAVVIAQRNIAVFKTQQSKEKTFPLSVQNFIMIMVPLIIITAVAAAVR